MYISDGLEIWVRVTSKSIAGRGLDTLNLEDELLEI